MKFSEAWLREWVDPPCDSAQLLATIGMAGIEIESVEEIDCGFDGVVVARVEAVAAHPNADRLRLCTVFDGVTQHQVVCGAANVRAGLLAPFAPVGASLKGGELRIKAAKLRGVESNGMLCSAAELNIASESSGLLELASDLQLGQRVSELFAPRDRIVEVGLTPNRGDCLSIRGIAREVGVLFGLTSAGPAQVSVRSHVEDRFAVSVHEPAACPRYLGRVIRDVDLTRPTPLWMRERLRRGGMRSIDPAVDVTNYVLLELGQPLHAFDLARLRGRIEVRWAGQHETLTMLDGKSLALTADTLVIADADGPVAMAGIMGGQRSGTQEGSTRCDVFIESAFFAPSAIRGRARRYGLHTEASQRYERGVDFELPEFALERASSLLLEIAGGVAGPIMRAESIADLPTRAPVRLRHARLERLLGCAVPTEVVESTLAGLQLHTRRDNDAAHAWTVAVPSHRFDIEREEDLIEEVCRIYGYHCIPVAAPITELALVPDDAHRVTLLQARRLLVGLGYQEAITYSFLDPTTQDLFDPGMPTKRLDNPLSIDMSVMRTSLVPGLVRAALYNRNRQQQRCKLFEIGRCFIVDGERLRQPWRLAAVLVGSRAPENWTNGGASFDFFDAKGDVERLLPGTARFEPLSDDAALHPGQAAAVLDASGARIGRVGRLHPALLERLALPSEVFVFELELSALAASDAQTYQSFSAQPSVRRDLALLIRREVPAQSVEVVVRELLGDALVHFTFFDVYAGEGIDSEKKSLGLGLTLQHPSRTLDEEEVSTSMATLMAALTARFDARQR